MICKAISPRWPRLLMAVLAIILLTGCVTGEGTGISHPGQLGVRPTRSTIPPMPPHSGRVSDIDTPSLTKQIEPSAWGIIITNERYKYAGTLSYADNDASVMGQYFHETFGVPDDQIIKYNPTKTEFENIFNPKGGDLEKFVKDNLTKVVYIYYSGHGALDDSGRACFVPYDGNALDMRTTGYPLDTFFSNLINLPVQRYVVIIDACFSGISPETGEPLVDNLSRIRQNVKPLNLLQEHGSVIFVSSGPTETSSRYKEGKHGLFTYCFLRGLKGEADLNSDRTITVKEMKSYLLDSGKGVNHLALTKYHPQREQHPQVAGNDSIILYNP
jgi:hypothetical protein